MAVSDYKYWLGKDKSDLKWVNKRGIHRRDADDKATGKAVFGRDVKVPGMLYARILACPYAHAKIKSMDTSAAEALPGVRAVLRYDDPEVPQRVFQAWDPEFVYVITTRSYSLPTWVLAQEGFFEGSPMGVAIAAEDQDIADEAMDLVKIEWEVKDFVIEYEKALEPDAPIVYDYMESWDHKWLYNQRHNISCTPENETFDYLDTAVWEGKENATNIRNDIEYTMTHTDMEAGWAAADHTIEYTFKRTDNQAFSPEIPSCVAQWTDDGCVEIWEAMQDSAHKILDVYALMLGVSKDKFHIHTPYCGGSFGGWTIYMYPQHSILPVAALLSKKANRPVKVNFKRHDASFSEMDEGKYTTKVGFKDDGTITAVECESIAAQMMDMSSMIPDTSTIGHLITASGIPNLHGHNVTAWLNKHGSSAHRCEQQAAAKFKLQVFARVAAELGVDEGTIAIKNEGKAGHGWEYVQEMRANNQIPQVDNLPQVIQLGKDAADWDNKWHAPGAKKLANGKLHGIHMHPSHAFSGGGSFSQDEYSRSKLMLSVVWGKIFIVAHKGDSGTDARTGYARVVAEETGMNLADVVYSHENEANDSKPHTYLSGGGGSIVMTGNSWQFWATAKGLKQKMISYAAGALKMDAADLDIVDSNFVSKNDPSTVISPVSALSSVLQGLSMTLKETPWQTMNIPAAPVPATWYQGRSCNIMEVEVDPETGGYEIVNAVCVNDVGLAISPETVEGQIYGAAIMGHSTGGIEEQIYDPGTGIRLNPNFVDYKILTMADIPNIEAIMVENRIGAGPYGSAGIGEDNTTFCSAMAPCAIFNAIGKWVDYPPTPERILKALGKA
jgi:xanthine dehydrogenase molybdenum-binding subunit